MLKKLFILARRAFSAMVRNEVNGQELSKNQKMLLKIAGFLVLLPLGIWAIFSWKIVSTIMMIIIACVAMREYLSIIQKESIIKERDFFVYLMLSTLIYWSSESCHAAVGYPVYLIVTMIVLGVLTLERLKSSKQFIASLPAAVSYMGLFVSFVLIRDYGKQIYLEVPTWLSRLSKNYLVSDWHDQGCYLLVITVLAVVACDTFAYIGGKCSQRTSIGQYKLAPKLSPNKTVVGSISGLIGAILVTIWLSGSLNAEVPFPALLGLIVGVISQIGDLVASGLKRLFGVKDSGQIVGHDFFGYGGILDRFDSHMYAVSAAYIYFWFVIH